MQGATKKPYIQQYFECIGILKFKRCLEFIKEHQLFITKQNNSSSLHSNKLNSINSSSSIQGNYYTATNIGISNWKQYFDDLFVLLKQFAFCEQFYYACQFGNQAFQQPQPQSSHHSSSHSQPSTPQHHQQPQQQQHQQDLLSMYSTISSQLNYLSIHAPVEIVYHSTTTSTTIPETQASIFAKQQTISVDTSSPNVILGTSLNASNSLHATPNHIIPLVDYQNFKYVVAAPEQFLQQKQSASLLQEAEDEMTRMQSWVLSKNLIKEIRQFIQIRLEMIAFYRNVSQTNRSIPKYEQHAQYIKSFKARLIQRLQHPFLEFIKWNTKYELDVLYVILKSEILLNRFRYKEVMFSFWETKYLLRQWNSQFLIHVEQCNKTPIQFPFSTNSTTTTTATAATSDSHGVSNSTTTTTTQAEKKSKGMKKLISFANPFLTGHSHSAHSSEDTTPKSTTPTPIGIGTGPQVMEDYFGDATKAKPIPSSHIQQQQQQQQEPTLQLSVTSPIVKEMTQPSPNIESVPLQGIEKRTTLTSSHIYRWLKMLFGFSVSKASLYFHDLLLFQFQTNSQLFDTSKWIDLHNNNTVDYLNWIKSFHQTASPLVITLLYNTQGEDFIDLEIPIGYSLEKSLQKQVAMSSDTESDRDLVLITMKGIKSYPCVFVYPFDTDKQAIQMKHWPNILSLIMDLKVSEKLESVQDLDPYLFTDKHVTYAMCKVDPKMYLVVVFDFNLKLKQKSLRLTIDFMNNMNSFLRNVNLFSFLTTTQPNKVESN